MRSVNNNLLGGLGLANYLNSSTSSNSNLIELMNNKNNATTDQQDLTTTQNNDTGVTASGVSATKGYYDSKTGTWVTSGNQAEVYQDLVDRQGFNQTINNVLTSNGIKLTSKDKMTLTIDQDNHITVSGISDEQKKAKIEAALNGTKDLGSELLLHIEKIKSLNGTQNPLELVKWLVSGFLKNQDGQELGDLKLVNGKITGANEKLQKVIDSVTNGTGDASKYQETVADLKSVLAYGADKIADLKISIDFQKGSLIDQNVKYGFGPDQLKSWFGDVMSGKARLDAKA